MYYDAAVRQPKIASKQAVLTIATHDACSAFLRHMVYFRMPGSKTHAEVLPLCRERMTKTVDVFSDKGNEFIGKYQGLNKEYKHGALAHKYCFVASPTKEN